MAEIDRLFGNMSDKDYKIWMSMSKEERQEMARKLALEKRQAKAIKEADDMAKAKAFRRAAQGEEGRDMFSLFPELRGGEEEPVFNQDYSLETSQEGLAAQALANEKLKIEETDPIDLLTLGKGGPSNIGAWGADAPVEGVEEDTMFGGGFMAPEVDVQQYEKKEVSATRGPHDKNIPEAEVLKKPSFMGQKRWDDIPISERRKVLENIKRTEGKNAIKSGVFSSIFKEVSHILSAASPISWVNPADNKYTMLRNVDEEFRPSNWENVTKTAKGIYDKINETLDPRKLGKYLNTKNLIAFLKSKGMPVDKHIVEDIQRLIKDSEPYVEVAEEVLSASLPIGWKESKFQMAPKLDQAIQKKIKNAVKNAAGRVFNPEEDDERSYISRFLNRDGDDFDASSGFLDKIKSSDGKTTPELKVVPPVVPETTVASVGHVPHGRRESYDYNEKDYEGKDVTRDTLEDLDVTRDTLEDLDAQKQSDEQAEENLLQYGNAKTEDERNKVVKKVIEAETTTKKKKEAVAFLRENDDKGPDRYFVDPFTGWAMCLTCAERRKDRKQIMELAKTLPADARAAYYFSKNLIKRADFDLITKDQKLKDAMARELTQLKIDEAGWKIISAKATAEKDPKKAEYLKMFLNASSNKNYELLSHLGGLLDLDEGIMKTMKESQLKYEMAKIKSKTNKGGLKTAFSSLFGVDYSTVITNKLKWIDKATAIIQTKGKLSEYVGLDGTKMVDRSGRFRTYGLKEQSDMKKLSHAQQTKIVARSPYAKLIMGDTAFHNSNGKFDVSLLVNNKDAYERYLKNDLVYLAMNDAYNEEYEQMMAWVAKNSYNYLRDQADLKKLLTAGASVTDEDVKKNKK